MQSSRGFGCYAKPATRRRITLWFAAGEFAAVILFVFGMSFFMRATATVFPHFLLELTAENGNETDTLADRERDHAGCCRHDVLFSVERQEHPVHLLVDAVST